MDANHKFTGITEFTSGQSLKGWNTDYDRVQVGHALPEDIISNIHAFMRGPTVKWQANSVDGGHRLARASKRTGKQRTLSGNGSTWDLVGRTQTGQQSKCAHSCSHPSFCANLLVWDGRSVYRNRLSQCSAIPFHVRDPANAMVLEISQQAT